MYVNATLHFETKKSRLGKKQWRLKYCVQILIIDPKWGGGGHFGFIKKHLKKKRLFLTVVTITDNSDCP